MKTRFYISTKEAQKILYTQADSTLFDYFFSDGYEDSGLTLSKESIIDNTEWSIIKEVEDNEATYKLDWKNSIAGLGSGFWGNEPMVLDCNLIFMRFPLYECYSEVIED